MKMSIAGWLHEKIEVRDLRNSSILVHLLYKDCLLLIIRSEFSNFISWHSNCFSYQTISIPDIQLLREALFNLLQMNPIIVRRSLSRPKPLT
jgi:hypothetical protein